MEFFNSADGDDNWSHFFNLQSQSEEEGGEMTPRRLISQSRHSLVVLKLRG